MADQTEATATYLERENVLLRFAHSGLLCDHATVFGGDGKGPAPGDLLLAALASASAFGALDAAKRQGLAIDALVARTAYQVVREGIDGPLSALAILARFWRRLEINGGVGDIDPALLAGQVGMGETIRRGLDLDERVTFVPTDERREPGRKNDAFIAWNAAAGAASPGERAVVPSQWRIAATPLDEDTVLVRLPGAPLCVSRIGGAGKGPTPHELLLGGLGACTAIYVGRNAAIHGIPVERASVTTRAATPADLTQTVARIEKSTTIVGALTEAERAKCRFFADHCCLGLSLVRGAELTDDVVAHVRPGGGAAMRSLFADLERASAPPSDLVCDDGSCCVDPAPEAKAARAR